MVDGLTAVAEHQIVAYLQNYIGNKKWSEYTIISYEQDPNTGTYTFNVEWGLTDVFNGGDDDTIIDSGEIAIKIPARSLGITSW